jgi:hypothetical protein
MSTKAHPPTDATPADVRTTFRERAARRRFNRTWLTVVIVLAVAAAGLGVASVAQGPRLLSAAVNAGATIERSGQRLVLQADQPLATVEARDVTVEPAAPIELTADGARLTVQFTGMLRYATEYHVSVRVLSAATGAASRLEYRFITPDLATFSLVRHDPGADGTDRVVRHSLSGDTDDLTMLQVPRIQEYVRAGEAIAAVVLDERDAPSLVLVAPDGTTTPVSVPSVRGIRSLRVASSGDLLGYLVEDDDAAGTTRLTLLDLSDASWVPIEVRGPAGTTLSVLDWTFAPGTTSVVAQAIDQQIYLVDPIAGSEATPLGQHTELRGFLGDTLRLVVADPDGGAIIDLTDGTTTDLGLPLAEVPPGLYPDAFVLTSSTSYVELYTDPMGYADVGARSILYAVDAEGTRELFRPATATSRIGTVCLSPNGEYLAVEVVPGNAKRDDYRDAPGWSGTTIYYVDAASGATSRGVTGMAADWCAQPGA